MCGSNRCALIYITVKCSVQEASPSTFHDKAHSRDLSRLFIPCCHRTLSGSRAVRSSRQCECQLLVQFVSERCEHANISTDRVKCSGDSYTRTGFVPTGPLPTPGNPLGNPPYPVRLLRNLTCSCILKGFLGSY